MTRALHAFEHFLSNHPYIDTAFMAGSVTLWGMGVVGVLHLIGGW